MAQKKIVDLTLRSNFDGTCNLPVDDAVQTYRVTGAQILAYVKGQSVQADDIKNLSLVTSVGASALTIAVKTSTGGNASSSDVISVAMRNSSLTDGSYLKRTITAALSTVITSGSTLGQVSGQPSVIYVYLIDNAGTLELAYSHTYYPEDALVTTTAEGGAGGADSAALIYSTTARSSVALRYVGYILNTQATAGTWASAGTQIQLGPFQGRVVPIITKYTSSSGTHYVSPGTRFMKFRVQGSGGGGAANSSGNGGAGNTSSLGTALISCGGGGGGVVGDFPGGGGTASLGTGPVGFAIVGGTGSMGSQSGGGSEPFGGSGAASPFGGAGGGGPGHGSTGTSAAANSGSGGGSGGGSSGGAGTSGGSAGGYAEGWLGTDPSTNPLLASYAYVVGAAGAGGTGGSTSQGGAGGSGVVILEEY